MSKLLKKTEFGNQILRNVNVSLSDSEIGSVEIQHIINDMYYTLELKKYGVGIAAPQVGKNIAISTIDTKPTPTRPDIKREKLTIINPVILKTYGHTEPMWEGCISGSKLYAKVPRHTKILLKWKDEKAKEHEKVFEGFLAHVIQHEVDHLNGVLFVDKVVDTKSYMTFSEYKKMRKIEKRQHTIDSK